MLSNIKQRLDREDEGFTLIELMVVVLIIAILLAIAIPTFLGARGQANSRAAQSSLRNSLTAEQTYYTNNQAFGTNAQVVTIEPNLHWQAGSSTAAATEDPNTIYVTVGASDSSANDAVYLQAWAKDGNCYTVYQNNGTVASGSFGTGYQETSGACTNTGLSATASPTINSGKAVAGGGFYTSW